MAGGKRRLGEVRGRGQREGRAEGGQSGGERESGMVLGAQRVQAPLASLMTRSAALSPFHSIVTSVNGRSLQTSVECMVDGAAEGMGIEGR